MSSYKLYYFNVRGSAESSRIVFAQAGVKYEDIRYETEQWDKEFKQSKAELMIVLHFSLHIQLKKCLLDVCQFWKWTAQ